MGYDHQRTVMLGSETPAHVSMAGVHRVAALIKRWILGIRHGSVQPALLDAYLDESVFRFNRRTSALRGMLFYRLLQQAVVTDPVTYEDVACGLYPSRPRPRRVLDMHPVKQRPLELSGYPSHLYSQKKSKHGPPRLRRAP